MFISHIMVLCFSDGFVSVVKVEVGAPDDEVKVDPPEQNGIVVNNTQNNNHGKSGSITFERLLKIPRDNLKVAVIKVVTFGFRFKRR